MLNALEADAAGHRASMFAAMRGDADHVGDLVRRVISQPVTIHDEPNSEAVLDRPYRLPSFSLHPGTLRGYVNNWLARYDRMPDDEVPPFGVKYLVSETDPDDSSKQLYHWEPVTYDIKTDEDGEEKVRSQLPYGALVIVHPALATYNGIWGFLPDEGGDTVLTPELDESTQRFTPHNYQLETYATHIELVHRAAFRDWRDWGHSAYWRELEWGARKLAERMGIPYAQMERAAELTVILHDVGKLGTGWQSWVRDYQDKIGRPIQPGEAYAHTDSTTDQHRQIERQMRKRPPHAVESAVGAAPLLMELPEGLRQAAFTAICRHHGAFTTGYQGIKLIADAPSKVRDTLESKSSVTLYDKQKVSEVHPQLFVPLSDSRVDAFFVYALLVRLLRRSDVRGTMWNKPLQKDNNHA
jgi:hypothetical protein